MLIGHDVFFICRVKVDYILNSMLGDKRQDAFNQITVGIEQRKASTVF